VLAQAGYEPEEPYWDFDAFSRAVRDAVIEGSMSTALFVLHDFYHQIHEEVTRYRNRPELVLLRDFVFSVIAINEMPGWLRRELIEYLPGLEYGGSRQEFPVAPAVRKKVLARIGKELRKPTPSVKGLPMPDYRTA